MGRKKIAEFENVEGTRKALVYRDSEWQEYRVTFYAAGTKLEQADHHTSGKLDALQTACGFVFPDFTAEQWEALHFYRERQGKKWKDFLSLAWWLNEYAFFPFNERASLLHQIRNHAGPQWLASFPVNPGE